MSPLIDPYGRRITGLRMALTSRCNLRCTYCHHEGEISPASEMPGDKVVKVIKAASDLGVRSIKFTGGEPLLRDDLEDIFSRLPSHLDLSITTNGVFLNERASSLAQAGLDRVNVSLDSLKADAYSSITNGSGRDLLNVISGIDAALDAGLCPVKLNVVVLKENQGEIWDLVEFARKKGVVLQLIELLDFRYRGSRADIAAIEDLLESQADKIAIREMHRRKKYFLDGAEVEVVRPMDNTEFCAHCTRLRVTSDGKLKPCLLRNDNLVKIRSEDEEEIKRLLEEAVAKREPYFKAKSAKPHRGIG